MNSMRIIALPLAKLKPSHRNAMLVFYDFNLISPRAERKELPWHKKMLKNMADKAADLWIGLGKAPKGSWKLRTYEFGERLADRLEFEELALRNIDPSLGPTVPQTGVSKQVNANVKHSHPKIPLIYPPSLYPAGVDYILHPPLAHLRTLLASRGPRHRRGFYLWMLIAPLTAPIALIPIIPNLPLFFCVWRSWSHYRAYRSSQYLSSLLHHDMIEPKPSPELDALYESRKCHNLPSPSLASGSSEKTSLFTTDEELKATSGTEPSRSESIILSREAVPRILEMFRLPEIASLNIYRAMDQARARLEKPT